MSGTEGSSAKPDTTGVKFGFYWLMPGITKTNAATLLFAGSTTIAVLTFMAFGQPFLFDVIGIPQDQQGALTGFLGAMQEAVFILLVSLFGALSDNVGRRIVYVGGMIIMGLGYFFYPLAISEGELIGFRIFYAVGLSAVMVMMHTCFAEYSQDVSRGKWMGTVGFFNALGVTIMALLLVKMPSWYVSAGYSDLDAIRFSYWTFGAYLLVLAIILKFGLQCRTAPIRKTENILKQASRGFAAARTNPRIALAYGMAFASRGDLVVLTSFFTLWVFQAGLDDGLTRDASTVKAGMLFGLSQGAGLIWAFCVGFLFDKVPRLTSMCIAFGLATVGYLSLGMVTDPFGVFIIFACIMAGVGESSALVGGGVMIGQEAPPETRGAVLGTFSLMGGIGIMSLTFLGGILFDQIGPTAPFVMMGIINFLVFGAALYARHNWNPDHQPSRVLQT